jgi:hypothetical protein
MGRSAQQSKKYTSQPHRGEARGQKGGVSYCTFLGDPVDHVPDVGDPKVDQPLLLGRQGEGPLHRGRRMCSTAPSWAAHSTRQMGVCYCTFLGDPVDHNFLRIGVICLAVSLSYHPSPTRQGSVSQHVVRGGGINHMWPAIIIKRYLPHNQMVPIYPMLLPPSLCKTFGCNWDQTIPTIHADLIGLKSV